MAERELGNFSQWSLGELQNAEKFYPSPHRIGDEIRAEIGRRTNTIHDQRQRLNLWYAGVSVIAAIMGTGIAVYLSLRGN